MHVGYKPMPDLREKGLELFRFPRALLDRLPRIPSVADTLV